MAEEVTSIRLGCTTSPGSGHEPDVERLLEKAGCEAVMLSGDPLQHLLNGEVDALVMDAQMQDLPVGVRSIGALPRRDPSLVLVCSDKPSHLVRGLASWSIMSPHGGSWFDSVRTLCSPRRTT